MSKRILLAVITFMMPILSFAADIVYKKSEKPALGIGQVAVNLMEPVSIVSDFIHTACIVIGVSFLFASFIKYVEHRRSPLMTPISTVLFLLIAGIVLILLPLTATLVEGGVSYSLIKL